MDWLLEIQSPPRITASMYTNSTRKCRFRATYLRWRVGKYRRNVADALTANKRTIIGVIAPAKIPGLEKLQKHPLAPGALLRQARMTSMRANGNSRRIRRSSSKPLRSVGIAFTGEGKRIRLIPRQKIVYPYAWDKYNVLVLPPSFPYGKSLMA